MRVTGRAWVGLPAIKPHAFTAPANQKAETMQLDTTLEDYHRSRMTGRLAKLISSISYPAKVLTRRFENLTTWKQDITEEATRIPAFYGAEIGSNSPVQMYIVFIFSIMFGLADSFALVNSGLPTSTENSIWVFSASITIIVPTIFMVLYTHYRFGRPMLIAKIAVGIYILARITLFVLGCTTLRDLPPAALDTIHWPNFILFFIGN